MKLASTRVLVLVLLLISLAAAAVSAANNRPLIFGMNPTPMDWWGYDKYVWDPLLFQKMAEAGCATARIGINWDVIEPAPGVRDWTEIDRWVKLCLDNNIEPLILINSTPTWALPDYVDPAVAVPEARYPVGAEYTSVFDQWCFDVARRFRGRARYYEFWNEANGYGWYTALLNPPSYSRFDLYTPWMIRAYRSVKLADPASQMSTTGIDDGGGGHAAYFIEGIYSHGGQGYFDAVADHPYSAAELDTFKLDDIRSTLDAHGDTHVKVWITEYGYSMDSGSYPAYQGYVTDYFNTLTSDDYDYVRIATWHTANEFPWEAGYGLMNKDLTPKPPYNTFKNYAKPARPVISTPVASYAAPGSIRISYTTNIASRGLVMYGPGTAYGQVTAREAAASTSHEHILTGLQPGAAYHYRVRTGTVDDGDSFSADRGFVVPSASAVRVISGPRAENVTETSATITWTTDVPASGRVEYGFDFAYGSSAADAAPPSTSHAVALTGLQSGRNYQFRVVSEASGLAPAAKEGTPFTTVAPAVELVNGGFETGTSGWTFWEVYPWGAGAPDYPGHVSLYTNNGGAFRPTPATKEGDWRLTVDRGYASSIGGVYQTLNAPSGTYLVSGWVASGGDGGDESVQLIAMDGAYSSGIPTGTLVADLSSSSPWQYYSQPVEVTSGKLTIATRVSQYYAYGAVAGHFDGISVTPLVTASLGQIKQQQAGQTVMTDAPKVVSAVFDSSTFYVQEPSRACGIRVRAAAAGSRSVGERVTLYGTLGSEGGEQAVVEAVVTSSEPGVAPVPLSMQNRAVGSAPPGLANTGLLVRAFGRITPLDASSFSLDDGSGPLKCLLPSGVSLPPGWTFGTVTGVSGLEAGGVPVLRVRSAADLSGF